MIRFNDNLDPEVQIDMEEEIASALFNDYDVEEYIATAAAKDILLMVLSEFRPDLTEQVN